MAVDDRVAMMLSANARLGPYQIVSPLGAGGMGEVYKARDTRLDRTVAIKILTPELATDPDLRARFEREARAIAALDHPHICAVHDVGEHGGTHYIVMQYLEGDTLAARLARTKGPLPLDQALKIAVEIADALDKAHRAGMTHRDLTPANIMLTKSGAMLLDFGLAKLRGAGGADLDVGDDAPGDADAEYGDRDDPRHRALHGAGAGGRARGRRARRHLGAGSRDLRDGDGHAAVRRWVAGVDHRRDSQGHAARSFVAAGAPSDRAGSHRYPLPRERTRRSLAERRRSSCDHPGRRGWND